MSRCELNRVHISLHFILISLTSEKHSNVTLKPSAAPTTIKTQRIKLIFVVKEHIFHSKLFISTNKLI